MRISLNRFQVDEALDQRGTDLETFVAAGRAQGKSIREIAEDLRDVTGTPLSYRTLYRWLDGLKAKAS